MSPLDDAGLDSAIAEAFGEEVAVVEPIVPEAEPVTAFGEASDEDGTTPQEERSRDELGRFAPKTEDPDVQRFLQRFDGDVDKALRAAVEADSMIGRQGQQMGELQKQLSEIQEAVTQPDQPEVQITQETVDWFDEQIEQNPQGAAIWAMQNDSSGALYNRALDQWFDMAPRQASAFERQFEMSQFAQAVQQQQAPLQQMAVANEFGAAWNIVKQEIPDLDSQSDAILQAVAEAPEIVMALQSGTPESKQRVIRNLYKLSKFEQANQLASAAQPAQDQQANAAQAFVASGSQHNNPETKSAEDQWKEQVFDPAASGYYNSGWPT